MIRKNHFVTISFKNYLGNILINNKNPGIQAVKIPSITDKYPTNFPKSFFITNSINPVNHNKPHKSHIITQYIFPTVKSINFNVVGSINANGIVFIATNKQYQPYNLPSRLNRHLAAINRYVNPNNRPVPAAK